MFINRYRKFNKVHLRYALNTGISLLILIFLFTKVPLERIVAIVRHSKAHLFFLSVFVGALSIFIITLRWQVLLKYLGYKYDLNLLSKLVFMALFFNVYLPGGIAGDVIRVAILPEEKGSKEEKKIRLSRITASVVTDRIVGMIGLMFLAFIGFVFCSRLLLNSRMLPVFGLITCGIFVIFFILFSRRTQAFIKKIFAFPLRILSPVKDVLKNVMDALFIYRKNYSVFSKVIPLSIVAHMCVVGYFFLLAQSIGVNINFLKLLVFVPLIEVIASIPISVGGAGIRETATILLFSTEGIPAAEAMSVSLLSSVVVLLLGMVGGLLFLRRRIGHNKIR